MVADGRVMDYSNGMEGGKKERRRKEGRNGEKQGVVGRGGDGKKRKKEEEEGRDGWTRWRGGRGGGRDTDSYIKILKMYECI